MKIIGDEDRFRSDVLEAVGPVMVDFFATWCGPCSMMAEVLDSFEKETNGVTFCKVDVDSLPEVASSYGISSIPCVIVFRNGKEVARAVGVRSKESLREMLERK